METLDFSMVFDKYIVPIIAFAGGIVMVWIKQKFSKSKDEKFADKLTNIRSKLSALEEYQQKVEELYSKVNELMTSNNKKDSAITGVIKEYYQLREIQIEIDKHLSISDVKEKHGIHLDNIRDHLNKIGYGVR